MGMKGLYKISNAINTQVALLDYQELASLAPKAKVEKFKVNIETAGWRTLDKTAGLLRKSMSKEELLAAAQGATRENVINMLVKEMEARKWIQK
jgi:hypothetical protein